MRRRRNWTKGGRGESWGGTTEKARHWGREKGLTKYVDIVGKAAESPFYPKQVGGQGKRA